jgi:integrative and conjugative element protein (TIGR02256 family)
VSFLWDKLNKGIVISNSPYSCIIFSACALSKLKKNISRKINICESGGLLLGFIRENHFDVRDVTIPYKNDFSSYSLFVREDKNHINIFQSLKKKNKDITYIGEWHTHFEDNPRPSIIDLTEWDLIKSTRHYPIVFMILGKKDFYITVK